MISFPSLSLVWYAFIQVTGRIATNRRKALVSFPFQAPHHSPFQKKINLDNQDYVFRHAFHHSEKKDVTEF